MSNSINSLSPSFRDYLLLKNLVTDTVVDNGLQSLLNGIGYPAQVETLPNAVQPSNSIDNTGTIYQESNTILNQYQGTPNDYTQVNIVYNQTNSTITNEGPYNNSNELLNNSDEYRKNNTIKNAYLDEEKQSVINLNTQPVPVFQNLTSYIDENNNLLVGGPSTQAIDVLSGVIGGQGVGFDITGGGLIANEDIRATLLGRVLGATGVINDTPLGSIGGQQLLAHIGYNASFGLQQETIGSLNLNPLSLLQGKSLVTLNYSITVPKGSVGKVLNYAANILGVQSPTSLLEQSIFSFDDKGGIISIGNIERGNEIIKNSGKGQVFTLFNHLRANTNVPNPYGTTLRKGYAPGYTDDRKVKGENVGDGINSVLYARDNGEGKIIDFINGKENNPISSGNYERSKQISDDGWNEDYFETNINETFDGRIIKDGFTWYSDKINNQNDIDSNGNSLGDKFGKTEKSKKSILYKTQQQFKSGNIKSLVSGHGIADGKSQINSSISNVGGYTSKGSGVMSRNAIINGNDNGPENVFCRTWTSNDRYNSVSDLQKSRGLYGTNNNIFRKNTELSVLDDNGFVKISPLKSYNQSGERIGDVKKYMFSIENLAWNDNLTNLLPCEVGPGDVLSGHKGRIMWFPPYDITFSESTSANWDKTNFIGRGEPMYTYNNTERTGNLSWKIIIDHPNYLNFIGASEGINTNNFDDYVASFFAGCIPLEEAKQILTPEEIDKTETINAQTKPEEKLPEEVPPPSFNVYFPNDVYDIDLYPNYEDGKCNNDDSLYTLKHNKSVTYAEFSPDGSKVVTASWDKTAKIWDVNTGSLLYTLTGHTDNVNGAKFSPDGSKIVTASNDKTAKIWDTNTGSLLHTLTGHIKVVYHAEFSPDGSKVVTASNDKTAKIWDTNTGLLLYTLTGHTELLDYAEFSPDNNKVVTASWDKTAKIWDVNTGSLLYTLTGHTDNVNGAKFSPDGSKIVTASNDKTAKIWDTNTGSLLYNLAGHTDWVRYAGFSPDGGSVVTASDDKTAKIWTTIFGLLLNTLDGHTDIVYYAEFSPDGSKVVTSSWDKTAKIWDTNTSSLLNTLDGHTKLVRYAKFSPDGSKVVTASWDNTAKIWDNLSLECYINYKTNADGSGFGLKTYTEQCYQFKSGGKTVWSSAQCTKSGGETGRLDPDRTDYGLNATGNTTSFMGTKLGNKKYQSWRDPQYHKDLQDYLLNKCKNCKVEVIGYASDVGTFGNDRNGVLSNLRANNVKDWLLKNILTNPPFSERVSVKAEGLGSRTGCKKLKDAIPDYENKRKKNFEISVNDKLPCKEDRYVTVKFVVDPSLNKENKPTPEKETVTPPKLILPKVSPSRFYSECDYFEKLKANDRVVYDDLKSKIKYFQPAFHSTTPEGFNARLNFLQQCMRQGPTKGAGDNNNPNNLAFGRPPICILRIGDFYHTKIIIDNLNFTFEPLVWDLNPEGVGVQPMICNVDMSFSFIGGSSLTGPINKLQNAVSFNYFANSEMYDPRADTIVIKDSTGKIVDGETSISAYKNQLPEANNIEGLSPNITPEPNQTAQNNNANSGINQQPLNNGTDSTDLSPQLTSIKTISVTDTPVLYDNTGTKNDILIKMNSKNILDGQSLTSGTEAYVNGGIKITIKSIPIPNPSTGKIIDNLFIYEEVVKFKDDNPNKDILSLVGSNGYKIGTCSNEYCSLDIPDGLYNLSITHASKTIAQAVIIVGKPGGYFYPVPSTF